MKLAPVMSFSLLIAAVVMGGNAYGQREREVPPRQGGDYGAEFFDQLRRMFGRFREADLHHVFQMARPVQCSELVADKGVWQDVAFFSGKQKFGNWYRTDLDEVKNDFAVYVFTGDCRTERATLQVTTKVPVDENTGTNRDGRNHFQEIQVKVNAPVSASFNSDSKAYTFELPYLFRGTDQNGDDVYTFNPRHLSDRYVNHVLSRWECKAVTEEYVTYRFLICHTMLFGYEPVDIKPDRRDKPTYSFGASTYSILSDGKEASSADRSSNASRLAP
jgi:hypothetical protein